MSDQNREVKIANDPDTACTTTARAEKPGSRRLRLWINWVLALLTVPAAAVVLLFGLGAVMSTAGCSDKRCPNLGPGGIGFGVLFYGAPIIALAAIVASIFTAKRRWGIVVPLCGLALLIADLIVLAVTFRQ